MVKLTPDVQRPFVNVFTQFRVQEPANSAIVGQCQSVLDKHIGKRVYRIVGSVPAANFISIPKLPSESLGLVGKNLYIQLHVASSSLFVFHVLVHTKQGVTLDISVNNLNHTLRLAGLSLQYPISLSDKWSVLLLQLDAIVAQHTTYNFKSVKSIQFCANMHVRGALSSDNVYEMETLPRDFAFPVRNGLSLSELYDFIPLPPMSRPPAPLAPNARPLSAPSRLSDISNINTSSVSALNKSGLRRSFDYSDLSSPLLEMQHVVGATSYPGCCLWSTDGRCVIYACASAIIVHNFNTGDQRILNGHTGDVRFLATTSDGTMLLSCQAGPNPLIRVWSLSTCLILSVIALKGSSLQCISSSPSSLNIAVVLNEGVRQSILLYDMSSVPSGGRASLVSEFVSDVHINRVSFAPWDDSRLVSCGNRSIRLYRLHKGALRPFSIDLRNFSSAVFLDVCHEPALSSASESQRRCYVSTDSGLLFVVSYTTQMLERSFKLHSKAIRSIHVGTDAKHGLAIVTACDDKTCKVWPIDFSEFLAEVPQVAAVTSVCFSSDSLRVCMSTANGCICVLDVPSKKVSFVTHSHSRGVLNLICDPHNEEITTTSSDSIMRIWDLQSYDQRFEFVAHGDMATAVCYHPTQYKFVAGFKSGLVKSFDIRTQDVEHTCNTKMACIVAVAFTSDCVYLLCSSVDGRIAIIDAQRSFQVLRISSTCEPNDPIALAMHPTHHVACALGPHAGSIVVLDPQSGGRNAILLPPHGSTLSKLTFAAQGRVVIALSARGRLLAWKVPRDLVHWQAQHLWESPQLTTGSEIISLAVSDNALLAAIGTADCKIWVWSLPHPDEVSASAIRSAFKYQMFIGHSHPVTALTFSTNLKSLVSCEDGPTMITWTVCAAIALDSSDIIEEAIASKELELDRFRQQQRDADSPVLRLPFSHPGASAAAPGGDISSPTDTSESISEPNQDRMPVERFRSRYMQADSPDDNEYFASQSNVPVAGGRKTPSPLARIRARSAELISPAVPKILQHSPTIPPMPPLQAPTPTYTGSRSLEIHSDSSSEPNGASAYDMHNDDPIVTYDDVARDSKIQYVVPEDEAGMKLGKIMGYIGQGSRSVIWNQSRGILAHCSGSAVVVERLDGADESRVQEQQCFLHGLTSETTCITLSPSSHLLAGCGASISSEHGVATPAVVVWDISTNQPVATLTNTRNQCIKIVAFSPDGQALVAVGEGAQPTLSVWELYEDRVVATLHMDYEVTELVWLTKSDLNSSHAGSGEFVTCGLGGITFFCLTPSAELLYMDFDSESLSSMNYTAMALIESGRGVIIGNSEGILHEFWATDEGNECIYRWEGHQSGAITALSCSSVSPSASQGCLITAGHRPHVRLWLRSHQDGWKAIRDITLDATPVYVFVGHDYDGVIGTSNNATWHVKFLAGEGELLNAGPRHALTCLAWAPGSTRFATGDCRGNVEVWSAESGEMQWRFVGVSGCGPIASLQFGDADTLLVACSGTTSPGSSATILLLHLSEDEQCCNSIPDIAHAKSRPSLVTSSQVLGSFPDSEQRIRMAGFSHEPDVVYVAFGGQVLALGLRTNTRSAMNVLGSPDIQITDMAQHQVRLRCGAR